MLKRSATHRVSTTFGTLVALLIQFLGVSLRSQTTVTPTQWLQSQPYPQFAPGNHLPKLTRWGWQLSSNTCIEIASNWDYTLDLGEASVWLANDVYTNTNSMAYAFCILASNNPSRFQLSVDLPRDLPNPIPDSFWVTNSSGQFVDQNQNAFYPLSNGTPVISPASPDGYWQFASTYWLTNVYAVQKHYPISMILNGGEYGLNVSGFGQAAWSQDPRLGYNSNSPASPYNPTTGPAAGMTNLTPLQYSSIAKAHELSFLTAGIKQFVPNRSLYVFYHTGLEMNRISFETAWQAWGWSADNLDPDFDLPSFQPYYTGAWTNAISMDGGPPGFSPDLLTEYLNSVGYNIKLGYKTNYTWVSGGYDLNPANDSDMAHYMGFLKCCYTGGMIGGIAGAFAYPANGFDDTPFDPANPPYWLPQLVALSRVHAEFSHLEGFLDNSDLISGPQSHSMSRDQPAYEFTNNAADIYARVLARQYRGSNQWLICAWASFGPDRNVTVTIPTLGSVSILARSSGSVYTATTNSLTLMDTNGLYPTESVVGLAPPTNLRVISGQ